MRSRTNKALKAHNVRKVNETFDLPGCSHSFFKRSNIHQLYGNMTVEKYGKNWCLDQYLAIATFNLLDEMEMKKCFNWINLRPMYLQDINYYG